ncbi:hypothetical protein SDC9_86467 [bioreactor metagenome]|uniref:Uncharacterized protein n=1 Tax=bioreactor metagenome TaxID=1076179 RepID=A0A644ZIZ8_9ZZZZ
MVAQTVTVLADPTSLAVSKPLADIVAYGVSLGSSVHFTTLLVAVGFDSVAFICTLVPLTISVPPFAVETVSPCTSSVTTNCTDAAMLVPSFAFAVMVAVPLLYPEPFQTGVITPSTTCATFMLVELQVTSGLLPVGIGSAVSVTLSMLPDAVLPNESITIGPVSRLPSR